VLKRPALGADAALIGRTALHATAAGGEACTAPAFLGRARLSGPDRSDIDPLPGPMSHGFPIAPQA
jgi:hypothetical protein